MRCSRFSLLMVASTRYLLHVIDTTRMRSGETSGSVAPHFAEFPAPHRCSLRDGEPDLPQVVLHVADVVGRNELQRHVALRRVPHVVQRGRIE